MNSRWKLITVLVLALLTMLVFVSTAVAAPAEIEDNGSGMFRAEYTRLPDDSKAHYRVDLAEPKEEDGGFIDSVLNPLDTAAAEMSKNIDNMLLKMTNLLLNLNMTMTNVMIGVLLFAFDAEIINGLVDGMETMVQNVAGLSGTNITGGLYGSLIGFAVIAAALSMVYQMFFTRSQLGALQTVFKSVIAIGLAMLLFANFGPLIRGMNEVATEISATMLTGTVNIIGGESQDSEAVRADVASNMWNSFIARPYMILQYGTDDMELIGEERVNELLALPPGEERQEYVNDIELAERGNDMMAIESTLDRASFAVMFTTINAAVSLPIFGLALVLLIFSVWYLLMAAVSPFILVWAAFPGQFGVLKRYAIELMYPLVLKLIFTVLTLFIFTLGFLAYAMPTVAGETGIPQYYTTASLQLAMFGCLFFMRKRIARIFKSGDKGAFAVTDIGDLKSTMELAMKKMTYFAITSAATAVGGTAGGAAAGYVINKGNEEETAERAAEEAAHVKPVDQTVAPVNQDEVEPTTMDSVPFDAETKEEPTHVEAERKAKPEAFDNGDNEAGPEEVEESVQEEPGVEPERIRENPETVAESNPAGTAENGTEQVQEVAAETETVNIPESENQEYETNETVETVETYETEEEEEEDLTRPFARLNEEVPADADDVPAEDETQIPAERGDDYHV